MKKASALFFVLVIAISLAVNPAVAAPDGSNEPQSAISVEYAPLDIAFIPPTIGITDNGRGDLLRAYSVLDLGSNGSASITWTVPSNVTVRSSYNYKTGSGKIVVRVTGSATASITFGLYDSNDNRINSHTVEVLSTKTAIITFSNLVSSKEYYVKAENTSKVSTTLSGSVAAA